MSLCSSTLRANVRRPRLAAPPTLLPFLYQTATIQQWQSIARPLQRRQVSSRPNRNDDIPFADADGNLPPPVDDVQSTKKTTMTATERAAFEKLYKTFNTQGQGRTGAKGEHEELDQIADEYYEDDEDNSGNSLDKVFEAVLRPQAKNAEAIPNTPSSAVQNAVSADSGPTAETPQSKKREKLKAERDRLKKLELDERGRIRTLLQLAHTDRELWQILEREVFDPLRKLDLDGSASQGNPKHRSTATPDRTHQRILFANYPSLLLTALLTIRHHFPTSPYALMLLPTIKSLGRSSYALGATTTLYKHLLRTAWLQQSSYILVDSLLADMDTNAIEFDAGILEVLDAILKEHELARQGRFGRGVLLVHGIEQIIDDVKKIQAWRAEVARRLGILSEAPRPMPPRRTNMARNAGLISARNELVADAAAVVEQKAFDEATIPFEHGTTEFGKESVGHSGEHAVSDLAADQLEKDYATKLDNTEKDGSAKVVL